MGAAEYLTEKRDEDAWYNAQDFGRNKHLGEDWNMTTGGDTDCGQPVFRAAQEAGGRRSGEPAPSACNRSRGIREMYPRAPPVQELEGRC